MADENMTETVAEESGASLLSQTLAGDGGANADSGNAEAGKEAGANAGPADGQPAADKADAGKAGDPDKAKDDPANAVPDKPEGYELTFAKATQVDTGLLDTFKATAKDLGLTRAQAQKLGSMYEAHIDKAAADFQAAQTKALLDARKGWEAEIKKSPDFDKELAQIQSALRQFGDKELYDLLDQTNLGSHPKMWAFMAKVGKALAEPGFHGTGAGQAKSAAQVLYPGMN